MDAAPVDAILRLDEARRAVLTQAEKLKAERNLASKEIGRTTDTSAREIEDRGHAPCGRSNRRPGRRSRGA